MRHFRISALALSVTLGFVADAQAQRRCPGGRCPAPRYVRVETGTPVYQPVYVRPAPQEPEVLEMQPAPEGHVIEDFGFVGWINSTRASVGLPAVALDANLCHWAAANNGQQHARGMGHHVMGSARRQNSGWGSFSTVCSMWMASPAHRAALLDPTISFVGIAGSGAYWTFNAR